MTESEIQSAIRKALGRTPGLVLWRNNVGKAMMPTGSGRMAVRFGLIPGASDLIGIVTCGKVGRFIALEVKTERGKLRPDQARFLALVQRMGGFACVVRSVEDARAAVERARSGAYE